MQHAKKEHGNKVTCNKKQATGGNMQLATGGNRQQATGNRQQATGNRQQATGNRQQATGNRQQATGNSQRARAKKKKKHTSLYNTLLALVSKILRSIIGNTCVSMNQWVENPTSHTALDDILPCVDNATALETSMKSREVTSQLVNVINQVYEETKGRAKDAVISLINQEREGEQIDRALLNNVLGIYVKLGWDKWSTMKETLKLLCLLILLITMLEKHQIGLRKILVLITCSRYSWLKAFTVIAAAFAEDCLKKEIDRVDHYLHSRSWTKLIERYIPSVYFMLLMQDLMLPVVISYVNAAIDTTAIGFKRS
ncbi:chaperonin-like protein [Tanacetum coccineum]